MGKPKNSIKRRKLRFNTFEDILNDARTLAASGVKPSGNWTPGQIVGHVAAVVDSSVEGFDFKLPIPMRLFGRLMRGWFLAKGFPSGIKMPGNVPGTFKPSPGLGFEEAVQQLVSSIDKANDRRMNAVSPVLGQLNHEQWVRLHCRHAELHFGFMYPVKQIDEQSHTQANGKHERHTSATA